MGEFRFVWENKAFTISTSIGVVPIGSSSATAAELLSAADAACYAAKEKGRNRLQVYQPDDRWVIRNACVRLARFLAGNEETIVNINLSALSLGESDIVQFIVASAQRSGIAPRQLCFELTETAAVASMDIACGAMQEISDRGFSFSLDDFGTGLSSFSYLKTLPVRQIKIGDSYVRNMLCDPLSHAIVRSVVDIGNVLGVRVCAECVEDAATLEALAGMGVGHAQGFAVQRPIPLDEFLRMAQEETLVT